MNKTNIAQMAKYPYIFRYKMTTYLNEYRETFHAHPGFEFVYIHEGNGRLIIDQQTYAIGPGSLLFFQPFQLHRVTMEVTDTLPFVRSLITFEPSLLEQVLVPFPVLQSFFKHLHKDRLSVKYIDGLFEQHHLIRMFSHQHEILQALPADDHWEEYMHFLLGFLRVLRPEWLQRESSMPATEKRVTHRVENILQWIEEHYKEQFKLEQMAGDLYLSTYYISHLFRETTNSTLSEYVTARRIRQACLLLYTGSQSIPQIAQEVGLSNPSYFCQLFKKTMGVTPHQYRLNLQRKAAATRPQP